MAGKQHLDAEALTAIFDEFAPTLYKYAVRLCHDSRLADHIVGDAFAELLEQFVTAEGHPSDPRLYLYQSAYRSTVKFLGERQPAPSAEPPVSASDGSQPQDIQDALIFALKDELTKDQIHVMILYFLEDFNLKKTAEILDKNVAEIRASLKDIRKIIKNHPELLTDSLAALLDKRKKRRKRK